MPLSFDKNDVTRVFSRRSVLIAGAQSLLMGSLIIRLFSLGINRSSHYQTLADENRVKLQILLPMRGIIYDRAGRILVDNQPNYRLMLSPDNQQNLKVTLQYLEKLIGLDGYSVHEIIDEIRKTRRSAPFTLRQNLTWDEVCLIEVNTLYLAGISVEKGAQRFYPWREKTAHLIGYVQIPNEDDDVEKNFLHHVDYRFGKSGIEKEYNERLQGKAGYKEVEVNAVRKVVRELSVKPSVHGNPLTSTIDINLQGFIVERLHQYESASVVVMDVHNGEILAMVSSPAFDPNLFTNGIRTRDWQALINNPYGVMNNKAIHGLYAPGSTYKMIVALAALDSKKISPDYKVECSGYSEINGHRYHCWRSKYGHGAINMQGALRESCDVYFYEIAKIIGNDKIAKMAELFGLGQRTSIHLPGEKKGVVASRSWKLLKQRHNWTLGDTILSSIGQGYMLATPLQLAVMTSRLANGGKAVVPSVIKTETIIHPESMHLSAQHLNIITTGMNQVVNHPSGTAVNSRILTPGYEMAGKTGTSQVRRISLKERKNRVLKNEELLWKERDHALFVGYAPASAPRFAVAVVIEHGGAAAKSASLVARDILTHVQMMEQST